ncbi:MAG: hypothetical protein ACTSXC_03585 [Candidatus Freyarchaeota archaeon]
MMDVSEAFQIFYDLYVVLSESRSGYDRPSLRKVLEAYENWVKAKSGINKEGLRELRKMISDCSYLPPMEKLVERVKRLIQRLKQKYLELGIRTDDPLGGRFLEPISRVYQEAEYILDDALKRGLPLTVGSLERYIREGVFEGSDFPASILEVLRSVKEGARDAGKRLLTDALRTLRNIIDSEVNSFS